MLDPLTVGIPSCSSACCPQPEFAVAYFESVLVTGLQRHALGYWAHDWLEEAWPLDFPQVHC